MSNRSLSFVGELLASCPYADVRQEDEYEKITDIYSSNRTGRDTISSVPFGILPRIA